MAKEDSMDGALVLAGGGLEGISPATAAAPYHAVSLLLALAVLLCARSCLQLSSRKHEEAFWSSPSTLSFLSRWHGTFAVLALLSATIHSFRIFHELIGEVESSWDWFTRRSVAGAAGPTQVILMLCAVALPTTQLLWLRLWPRAYQLHWRVFSVLGRVLRWTFLMLSSSVWRAGMTQDAAGMASSPIPIVLLRMMAVWSCSMHGFLFSFMCLMPTQHVVPFQLLQAVAVVTVLTPVAVRVWEEHPPAMAAMQAGCQGLTRSLDMFFDCWPWQGPCSTQTLAALFAANGILMGCLLPCLVIAAFEYNAKRQFVAALTAQQQAHHPASSLPGPPPLSGHGTASGGEAEGEGPRGGAGSHVDAVSIGSSSAWVWAGVLGHIVSLMLLLGLSAAEAVLLQQGG